jgi:dolichyl-phosphate beta-glucosyltransferase
MSSPGDEPRRVSLVVPLRNEELRLGPFVAAVEPLVGLPLSPGLVLEQVVLVDDGSTDRTGDLLVALVARTGWTVVAASTVSRGKGDAVARGARAAASPWLLLSDVDLAAPLGEAVKLVAAIDQGATIAIGSRDVTGAAVTAPAARMVVGRAFNAMVRAATGLPIRDTQCGFKLLPTDVAVSLLSSLLTPGLAFDVELLMRARMAGHPVAEVPIVYHHGADSRVRPVVHAFGMGRDVLRLTYRLRVVPALTRRGSAVKAPT